MSFFLAALQSNQGGGSAYRDPTPPLPALTQPTSARKKPKRSKKPASTTVKKQTPKESDKKPPASKPVRRRAKAKAKAKSPSPSPSSSESSTLSDATPSPRDSSVTPSPDPRSLKTKQPTPVDSAFDPESDSEEEGEEEDEEAAAIAWALGQASDIQSLLQASDRLRELRTIIQTALQDWEEHLSNLISVPSYTDLINGPVTSASKNEALLHILETLPTRHRHLAKAYNDELRVSKLGKKSEDLKHMLQDDPEAELKYSGPYTTLLFKGKKFREEAVKADKEIGVMEQKRLDELKSLMGMVEKLDSLESEGILEMRAVQELIEAMEEVGLMQDKNEASEVGSEDDEA